MLGQILAIARVTFVEAIRQPIFIILVLAGGILQFLNTMLSAYSMAYTDSAEVVRDNKLLLDMGLATVFVLTTILAAFIATNVLSREIDNRTVLTVISKPVGRPLFVVGKYLGSVGALLLAGAIQLIFLLFAIRHGVLSTSADMIDWPVIVFASVAVFGSIGLGAWANYFYGWVFSSTTIAIMGPASALALVAIYLVGKDWQLQPITTDFKPQILLASLCLLLAMTIIAALALAASTRLKQVMTIGVCGVVFLAGLLSNYFLGRRAYQNTPLAVVAQAEALRDRNSDLRDPGDLWTLRLDDAPRTRLRPGDPVYFGPEPNGLALAVPRQGRFEGDPTRDADITTRDGPRALVVRNVAQDERSLTIANVGGIRPSRAPRKGDYVFDQPTRINPVAWAAWAVVPNLQFFWLLDAIAQAHPIPGQYILLVALYTLVQVVGLLMATVILFQRREVG